MWCWWIPVRRAGLMGQIILSLHPFIGLRSTTMESAPIYGKSPHLWKEPPSMEGASIYGICTANLARERGKSVDVIPRSPYKATFFSLYIPPICPVTCMKLISRVYRFIHQISTWGISLMSQLILHDFASRTSLWSSYISLKSGLQGNFHQP